MFNFELASNTATHRNQTFRMQYLKYKNYMLERLLEDQIIPNLNLRFILNGLKVKL